MVFLVHAMAMCTALADIDNPSIVKYRCENFLLTPEEWYEERGFVPNVTFPCATIHDSVSGKIAVYYGCADSYVGLAFTTVDEIVDYIKTHSHLTESDTEIGTGGSVSCRKHIK
jgi:beta-1,4-mannooligosaccharide/beta-1,4-mannosyl-N-acetylglucosamine phosphorylase